MEWKNWSGQQSSRPTTWATPQSEAEVIEVVRASQSANRRIRCVGAAHSHSPLVPTDETLVDLSALSGLVTWDSDRLHATVEAGTRISDLGEPLRSAGLALHNQGDIDRQSIAGAVATGTHGTGRRLQNLSASVVGARIILADGTPVECDADTEPELFQICRLSLGAAGIITALRLSVRNAYRLEECMWLEDLDGILERIESLTTATRHFEFFWQPGKQKAACKSLSETDAPPRLPLGDEGSRLSWSHEVLANERPDKHTEMEYSIPESAGPDCFQALREMITQDFPNLGWPVEYRTLASDDIWLSTARDRASVTISVHHGIDQPDEALFRASEEVFRAYDGRPDWGKVHYLSAHELDSIHCDWADWWHVRDQFDPNERFLNPYLRSLVKR